MRNRPNGAGKSAWTQRCVVAALACVMLLAGAATVLRGQSPGVAKTGGQAVASPSPSGAQPAMAQAGAPAQTDTKPADTNPAGAKPAQLAATPGQAAAPQTVTAGTDPQSQPVAQQTADLLKLATDLVNEINETRPETLSVAVVRKADAIEQLAKKMKGQP